MSANCDGSPRRSHPMILSTKARVCSRVKTPSEKRMKPVLAISSPKRSISSSRNGRRIKHGVSRTGIPIINTNTQRVSIYKRATQTVFGEGPKSAPIMLVGEQPGDYEDVAGKPFVGPAGKIMDQALEEAGIDRSYVYVTNAVKHFKWEPRGKRRIHKKPNSREIAACHPWLEAELRLVKPTLLVCLGATAAQAIFGPSS